MSTSFESRASSADRGLFCRAIDTLQVNVGFLCNQSCAHCHVDAGPGRTEVMSRDIMQAVLDVAAPLGFSLADITGGAPELNPHFRWFVAALRKKGLDVRVRTNLTVMLEDGMEDLPGFLADLGVRLVASLPCYTCENVKAQRGERVFEKSIEVIKRLNALGYGGPSLQLDLVYNPGGPSLPGPQASLEADYKRVLAEQYGVTFSRLLTITNMPIGRFREMLGREGRDDEYAALLENSFNPDTVEALMCRHQLSVGYDGTLYDCDFNLALGLPVDHGAPDHISRFDADVLARRRIVTGEHCFGCTAGSGSSCEGALL